MKSSKYLLIVPFLMIAASVGLATPPVHNLPVLCPDVQATGRCNYWHFTDFDTSVTQIKELGGKICEYKCNPVTLKLLDQDTFCPGGTYLLNPLSCPPTMTFPGEYDSGACDDQTYKAMKKKCSDLILIEAIHGLEKPVTCRTICEPPPTKFPINVSAN